MSHLKERCLSTTTLRFMVAFGLAAATLTGALAGPAYAENYQHQNQNHRGNEANQGWTRRGPPPQRYDYGNYYRRPDVYYSAPPIVVAPPYYYEQPTPSLNFVFPLVIR